MDFGMYMNKKIKKYKMRSKLVLERIKFKCKGS